MAWPDSFKEEVKRTADIAAYISDFVRLKKMGGSWKGLCPFHQEKTPSFNVRGDFFHCFGCGEGGDIFKFAMLHEKLTFPEAVEALARRFGVAVPARTAVDPDNEARERREREQVFAAMAAAAELFTKTLWSPGGTRAREYLEKRGFRKETLERIGAGAALESWDHLIQSLGKAFPMTVLQAAGLVVEKEGGGSFYDRFRNRAVFPILNESNRVVAFGARALDSSEPKYLNSPETLVYQKSRTLYGLSWARDEIRRRDQVVLMEGYLDVARAIECGIGEALATCGTALTTQHARFLKRFAGRVVLNFDQDAAGQKAARKSIEILLEEQVRVAVVELPEGHDPDSYLKAEGAEAYRKRLDAAPEAIEWLIRRGLEENDTQTPPGKAAFVRGILPALQKVPDRVERAAWVAQVASRGAVDAAATEAELRRVASAAATSAGPAAPATDPTPAATRPPATRVSRAERWLVALVLQPDTEGALEALRGLTSEELGRLATGEILRAVRDSLADGGAVNFEAVLAVLPSEGMQRFVRELAVDPPPLGDATPAGCVRELRLGPLKARMAEIQKSLASASGEALDRLLREKVELGQRLANL